MAFLFSTISRTSTRTSCSTRAKPSTRSAATSPNHRRPTDQSTRERRGGNDAKGTPPPLQDQSRKRGREWRGRKRSSSPSRGFPKVPREGGRSGRRPLTRGRARSRTGSFRSSPRGEGEGRRTQTAARRGTSV